MSKNIKICICIGLMLLILIILHITPTKKKYIYGGEEESESDFESENISVIDNVDCTLEQIKKHNQPNDKWIYNNGQIYDLTPIIEAEIINTDKNVENTLKFFKLSDEQDLSKLFKSIDSYNTTMRDYNTENKNNKKNIVGKDEFTIQKEIGEMQYLIKIFKLAKPKLSKYYIPTLSTTDRTAMINNLKESLKNENIDAENGPWKTSEDFDSSKLVLEWINKKTKEQSGVELINDFNVQENKNKDDLIKLETQLDTIGFDFGDIDVNQIADNNILNEKERIFTKFKFVFTKTLTQFSKGIICPAGLKI